MCWKFKRQLNVDIQNLWESCCFFHPLTLWWRADVWAGMKCEGEWFECSKTNTLRWRRWGRFTDTQPPICMLILGADWFGLIEASPGSAQPFFAVHPRLWSTSLVHNAMHRHKGQEAALTVEDDLLQLQTVSDCHHRNIKPRICNSNRWYRHTARWNIIHELGIHVLNKQNTLSVSYVHFKGELTQFSIHLWTNQKQKLPTLPSSRFINRQVSLS